jgi:hypothetical protein
MAQQLQQHLSMRQPAKHQQGRSWQQQAAELLWSQLVPQAVLWLPGGERRGRPAAGMGRAYCKGYELVGWLLPDFSRKNVFTVAAYPGVVGVRVSWRCIGVAAVQGCPANQC